jgi:hypothetical protein
MTDRAVERKSKKGSLRAWPPIVSIVPGAGCR